MQPKDRSIPSLLLIYFAIIGTFVLGVGYVIANVTTASEETAQRTREKSILDERIATARAIKEALARPVPRPEPLAPITAKPANANAAKIAGSAGPSKEKTDKLKVPTAARNAMARGITSDSPSHYSSAVDRAGAGGW